LIAKRGGNAAIVEGLRNRTCRQFGDRRYDLTQGFGVRVYLKQINEAELVSRVPAVALVIAFGAP
jgi:hypothetical protein